MPRPSKAPRLRRPEGLTEERLKFLIHGRNLLSFEASPFVDEAEMRECWNRNREQVLAAASEEPGVCAFLPGCRPWAYWRFDRGMDQAPRRQAAALELPDDERAAVVRLARAQMENITKTPIKNADLDPYLVRVWPKCLQLFEYDSATGRTGPASWFTIEKTRALTESELDATALDVAEMYCDLVLGVGDAKEKSQNTKAVTND